ncbi:MAG: nucleolar RNA-binding Nop10p family protein [Nanoarchaeota archaeon]
MAKHILRCPKCLTYSIKEYCECGVKNITPKPPKYSVDDKYAKYRRIVKKDIENNS